MLTRLKQFFPNLLTREEVLNSYKLQQDLDNLQEIYNSNSEKFNQLFAKYVDNIVKQRVEEFKKQKQTINPNGIKVLENRLLNKPALKEKCYLTLKERLFNKYSIDKQLFEKPLISMIISHQPLLDKVQENRNNESDYILITNTNLGMSVESKSSVEIYQLLTKLGLDNKELNEFKTYLKVNDKDIVKDNNPREIDFNELLTDY